jgi:hypothetical protein
VTKGYGTAVLQTQQTLILTGVAISKSFGGAIVSMGNVQILQLTSVSVGKAFGTYTYVGPFPEILWGIWEPVAVNVWVPSTRKLS